MPHSQRGLYNRLLQRFGPRCAFCRTSSALIGQPLTIEHIIPVSRGGSSDDDNLCLSCWRCNDYKRAQIDVLDPDTATVVSLYNPRRQRWQEHFVWSGDGRQIIGLTSVGRATIVALKLNNDDIVATRALWVSVGWHPPEE